MRWGGWGERSNLLRQGRGVRQGEERSEAWGKRYEAGGREGLKEGKERSEAEEGERFEGWGKKCLSRGGEGKCCERERGKDELCKVKKEGERRSSVR